MEVHQLSIISHEIWYQVGSIDRQRRNEVVWSEERLVDKGRFPKVAINNNDPATVVEVHEGRLFRRIYCRVGTLNGQYIDWEASSKPICWGRLPAVAIHDNRVVVTFDSAHWRYTTHYCLGEINPDNKTINWRVTKGGLFSPGATETSVAMNGEYVIAGGRGWSNIVYQLGQVQGDCDAVRIEWLKEISYDHLGYCPTLCLDNNGYVIIVWQSLTFRHLLYATGRVQNADPDKVRPSIQWHTSGRNYDYGYNPTIAICPNNGHVLEEHETNFAPYRSTLHYHTAFLHNEMGDCEATEHPTRENDPGAQQREPESQSQHQEEQAQNADGDNSGQDKYRVKMKEI